MNMGSLNKTILIPLLSFVALLIKQATGYDIPSQILDVGADAILSIVTIVGFFIHPTNGGQANGNQEYTNRLDSNK